jgi:S-adenosylmethionine synthetase
MFEKVNPGHPDKMADRLAGAVVDLAYTKAASKREECDARIGTSFGSLDVGLIDLDEIKKLKKEDVMAMLKKAEHLQWKGPEGL